MKSNRPTDHTLQDIKKLGRHLSLQWQRHGRAPEKFANLAEECLNESRPSDWLNPDTIADWCVRGLKLPEQWSPVSGFGEPPVTVYNEEDFFLEIYFWHHPLISVHDHAFSGAFTVLRGASLHCEYNFDSQSRLVGGVKLGQLNLKKAEHLAPGDVRRINSGAGFIHDVWHYRFPTVSLVARTKRDLHSQFVYHEGMAADTLMPRDNTIFRRLSMLSHMRVCGRNDTDELICELIHKSTPYDAFIIYSDFMRSGPTQRGLKLVRSAIRKKHPLWFKPMTRTLERAAEFSYVDWGRIHSPEARLLTCLLLAGSSKVDAKNIFTEAFSPLSASLAIRLAVNELLSSGAAGPKWSAGELSQVLTWFKGTK